MILLILFSLLEELGFSRVLLQERLLVGGAVRLLQMWHIFIDELWLNLHVSILRIDIFKRLLRLIQVVGIAYLVVVRRSKLGLVTGTISLQSPINSDIAIVWLVNVRSAWLLIGQIENVTLWRGLLDSAIHLLIYKGFEHVLRLFGAVPSLGCVRLKVRDILLQFEGFLGVIPRLILIVLGVNLDANGL